MPAASTLVLADSVPTNRNYVPFTITGLDALFVDVATAATPAGRSRLSINLKPATGTTAQQVNIQISLPVEYTDSTTGNILTKDTFRFKGQWIAPPGATVLQRNNFRALVQNAVAHAVVQGYIKDGDPVY